MTFTELAAAIDTAEEQNSFLLATVRDTERAVEAFLAQRGMELSILREDVSAAQDAYNSGVQGVRELYAELQQKMPVMHVVSTAPAVGTIPSTSEMKRIVLEGNRVRDARNK